MYQDELSEEILNHLKELDTTEIVEHVVQELLETKKQQDQLNARVDGITTAVELMKKHVGSLTHGHDQLSAKVLTLSQSVSQAQAVSRVALSKAENALDEIQRLRDETAKGFQIVSVKFSSLDDQLKELIERI